MVPTRGGGAGNLCPRPGIPPAFALANDPLARPVIARGDPELIKRWRRLTTSDHLYYMCTKWFGDGDVHKYFSPYETPYDAFVTFMNVLQDLEQRVAPAEAAAPATTALAG